MSGLSGWRVLYVCGNNLMNSMLKAKFANRTAWSIETLLRNSYFSLNPFRNGPSPPPLPSSTRDINITLWDTRKKKNFISNFDQIFYINLDVERFEGGKKNSESRWETTKQRKWRPVISNGPMIDDLKIRFGIWDLWGEMSRWQREGGRFLKVVVKWRGDHSYLFFFTINESYFFLFGQCIREHIILIRPRLLRLKGLKEP